MAADLSRSSSGNTTVLYRWTALGLAAVILVAAAALIHLHEEAEIRAIITTQNLARSIGLMFDGLVDTIDIALLASTDEISRQISAGQGDRESLSQFLDRQKQRLPEVDYLRATNENGAVVYGPDLPQPPSNNSKLDYFVKLKSDPKAGLLVRDPVIGHISNKWIWSFARRIDRQDGAFGGVVIAAIYLDRLNDTLARIHMPAGVSVTLRNGDLALISRYQYQAESGTANGDPRVSPEFVAALGRHAEDGTYTTSGAANRDGGARTHAYVRSAKYGFIVNVGIAEGAVLAEWYTEAAIVCALVLAFALALLAFSRQIGRSWRRQRQAAAALTARTTELEHEVAERTLAEVALKAERDRAAAALADLLVAQDQLLHAEKLASLGRLVAGVAHEINTPLGVAVTMGSLFSEWTGDLAASFAAGTLRRSDMERYLSGSQEGCHLLLANLRRSADLVHSFKQVAADELSDERRRFELGDCLSDIVIALGPVWRKAGHRVEVLCPEPIEVDGFPGVISQILTNLMTNSTLHGFEPGQSGVLTISAVRTGADGVELCYSDNGKGIAREARDKVFEPFYTTRRNAGSTGLGLHIVSNLVVCKLGGNIELHSEDGQGVRFVLHFPRTLGPPDQDPAQADRPGQP